MNKTSNMNKLMKLFISMFAMFAIVGFANAQQTIKGTVTDAQTGNTLVGAAIVIKGTTIGTITDVEGNYEITASAGDVLVYSFIGYKTREITVSDQKRIDVILEPTAESLEEVVVIGYGIQKKEDATGSVQAISSDKFNQGAITAPQDLLTGKIAGVQITSSGGAPGEGSQIRIRGGSSLTASNDPLIVVDGIPLDNEGVSGMRNPLNAINPNDIETFTVLKDASATAIYGSRASNGVIMITTKKSKEGAKLQVDYTGKLNMYVANKTVDVLGADEFRSLVEEKYPGQVGMLGDASTDWQDEIYQNATGMDHNLSISGAYKMLPYRLSIGYSDNDGILKTDNNKRTSAALNLNPSLFDDHLKVTLNAKYVNIQNKFADRGAIGAATQYDPTKPVESDQIYNPYYTNDVNADGIADTVLMPQTDFGGYYAWIQNNGTDQPVEQGSSNPVAMLNLRDDQSDVNRFIGNIQFDYKFHFLPELKANLNLGYDYTKATGDVIVPDYAPWSYNPLNGGGTFNSYEQEKKNELLDFYLTYTKDLDQLDSRLEVMAGYSWQHFWRKNYSINGNYSRESSLNPIIDTTGVPATYEKVFTGDPERTYGIDTINDPTELYLVSFFGRINYSLMDKYLLTFTLRDDGTSRFSPDTRWGLFPSVALGWKMNEEGFLKSADFLSQLKLRLGWGITGQQDVGGNYVYMPRYTYSQYGAYYMMGNQFYTTIRPEGYDYDIKWEETTTYNIGLDYGFLNDRFYGTLDFYLRKTNDLLNSIPVPAGTNLTNYIYTNIGDMENKGVEFSINTKPVVRENLKWELGLNATYNENKITKLTATDDPNYLGILTGGISGGVGSQIQIHSVGQSINTFFVYEQIYDQNGDPIPGLFVDQNQDGVIDDGDRVHKENPAPDMSFGISSGLSYKNWYFSFSGRANIGNYVYYNVDSENGVYERLYRPEGPYLSNIVSSVYESNFTTPYFYSDYYLKDGSFFRMDNISLSYRLQDVVTEGTSLTISATVNNAFVITKYDGLDPEVINGIDNRIYPRPTTYVLGLNLKF
jgi:iron complex outermembrane receptor protein